MRIIAGKWRGLALASVGKGDARAHLRPTADRVRENLFNMLSGGRFGDPITGARVLDLFAGTGALGFEALSRGAQHVTFVDNGAKSAALIRRNIELTQSAETTQLLRQDATRLGERQGPPFTLVFLDPPYDQALGAPALTAAATGGWLARGALVVWEERAPQDAPSTFQLRDRRQWGDTLVTFLDCRAESE